jgi:predicted helicase
LISTDVLSEGLNLQDATRMINSAQGVRDENVFDIQQGVAIAVAYRIDTRGTGRLEYGELLGSRSDKYQALHDESLPIEFVRLAPGEPDYLFVWRDETLAAEYEGGLAVDEMFVLSSSGVKTNRDGLTVAFTQDELDLRMDVFTDAELTSTEVSTALSVEDKKYWTVAQARSEVSRESWLASCADIHYRPFDIRRIVYHPSLVFSPRKPVMSQSRL